MAATFNFCEDNGAQTGGPPVHGTTRSTSATYVPLNANWKSADDAHTSNAGTVYTAAPIVAGTNSFTKYIYGQFSGPYNQILNVKWTAHSLPAAVVGTGLTLKGKVTSVYATPSQATNAALTTDYSAQVLIASGEAVLMSPTGPEVTTDRAATLASGGGYTQYLATQLQTTVSAVAGDIASAITQTLQYDES